MVRFILSQSRLIVLVTLVVAIGGGLALTRLPSGVYPELTFPRISVIAEYADIPPERAVISVTRLLEEACSQVYGITRIRSKTIRGAAELSVDFAPGTDLGAALAMVQSRVQEARGALPSGTVINVEPITPAIFPVLSYNLYSETVSTSDLYTLARYTIQPRLTRVEGLSRIQVLGGDLPEVSVELDPAKLRAVQLDLPAVAEALRANHLTTTLGRIDRLGQQRLLVDQREITDPSQLEDSILAVRNGVPIRLSEVGRVHWGIQDPGRAISVQGRPGIAVNLFRQPSAAIVPLGQRVEQECKAIRATLPPGIHLQRAYDISGLVQASIHTVRDAILTGLGLIVIVLYAFLRNWRSTLVAAVSIPTSALAALACMYLTGETLNLMSLGGLAISMGLVVDDAVVMVENIDRLLRQGLTSQQAVSQALRELARPVVTSTLTTVVVFAPLHLLTGVAGQFFTSLVVTLTAAVLASLVFSLTIIPWLSAGLLSRRAEHGAGPLERFYLATIGPVLRYPSLGLLLLALMMAATVASARHQSSEFLPAMDEGSYVIDMLGAPGTSLAEGDRAAREVEKILANCPEVLTWSRRTGAENGLFATQPYKGDITVTLKSAPRRALAGIVAEQRTQVAGLVPQLEIEFHQLLEDQINDLAGTHSPVEVQVFADNPDVLREQVDDLQSRLSEVKGLVDVVSAGADLVPLERLELDTIKTRRVGLSAEQVDSQVRDAILGLAATQAVQFDRLLDVRVRLLDRVRFDFDALLDTPITTPQAGTVPLAELGTIRTTSGEVEILREGLQRYAILECGLEGRDLGSTVRDVQALLREHQVPGGVDIRLGGLYSSQQTAFWELAAVTGLAITLVYLILVAQFRSYTVPLAIFAAIPPGLLGMSAALWVTDIGLNVSSLMGLILLVGLVVKNGILLAEYALELVAEGIPLEEALARAGSIRLRPILMTSLCTVLGLVPLALGWGAGAELQRPLAVAVLGGLSLSTVTTLYLVPVCLAWLSRLHPARHG